MKPYIGYWTDRYGDVKYEQEMYYYEVLDERDNDLKDVSPYTFKYKDNPLYGSTPVEFLGDTYYVKINSVEGQSPHKGSAHTCDSDWDYYGWCEVDWEWALEPPEDWTNEMLEEFNEAVVKEFEGKEYD